MRNLKRLFSLFIIVSIIFTLLLSISFVALEANHHHTDEDNCPICVHIKECLNYLNSVGFQIKSNIDIPSVISFFALIVCIISIIDIKSTLVTLKVKLSD